MQPLLQNRTIAIIIFAFCCFIPNEAFAHGDIIKSIRNGEPKITQAEMSLINSKIKSITAENMYVGLIGGEDRIYLYGKILSPESNLLNPENASMIQVIIVQFWMVHGNGDFQYVIALDRKSKKIYGPFRIGGVGQWDISIYGIDNKINRILACAKFFGPTDGISDPSLKGSIGMQISSDAIYYDEVRICNDCTPKRCHPWP